MSDKECGIVRKINSCVPSDNGNCIIFANLALVFETFFTTLKNKQELKMVEVRGRNFKD